MTKLRASRSHWMKAKTAAGDQDVAIGGGADVIQPYLNARLLHELQIYLVPIILGHGKRLFDNMELAELEKTRVIDSPAVTHMEFRVVK